jgi:hypothetical protein
VGGILSAKCPICGKEIEAQFRPFCSMRCKQIDLNRWLTETYRVPDRPGVDDDEAESPTPPAPEDEG